MSHLETLVLYPADIKPGDEIHLDDAPSLLVTHVAQANFQNLVRVWCVGTVSGVKQSVELQCTTKVKVTRRP